MEESNYTSDTAQLLIVFLGIAESFEVGGELVGL
jgi:hypothetical protein